jgi:hypothetical protein
VTETIFVVSWKLYGCKLPIQGIELWIYPHFLSHILQARETFGRVMVDFWTFGKIMAATTATGVASAQR